MLNYRTLAVLKREIRQQVFTKKFLIMTLSFPLIMALIIGLQVVFSNAGSNDRSTITVLTESASTQNLIREKFQDSEFGDPQRYDIIYGTTTTEEVEAFIEDNREVLLSGDTTGVVFVPDSAHRDKQIFYYSSNPGNQALLDRLRFEINSAIIQNYLMERNLDPSAVAFAQTNVRIEGIRVSESGIAAQGRANMIVAFFFTFLLYMSLLGMGTAVMGAVNEEKVSRVVEVLLSSISTTELMAGKILGTAIAGLAQMIIWLIPAVILLYGNFSGLEFINNLDIQVEPFIFFYFLFNYFIGLLTFLSIFAMFGSMFENPQDAQGSMMPVFLLIMIPFFLAMSMANNPGNMMAEVGSMLPFFSIMVMPARMTLIDVPLWQLGVGVLVNLATFCLVVMLSGKIYRFTILMTGKSPSWKEVYKWLRYD